MKKRKIKYSDEPIGKIERVEDFLPSPDQLILKEETTKVTLSLTKSSIEFFKEQATKNNTHYQAMIRSLIDKYTEFYRSP